MDEEEEDEGADHEEELELGGEVLEHGLVVDVPGEAEHGEEDEAEEAEVDGEAQVVPERVVVVVVIFPCHSYLCDRKKESQDRQYSKSGFVWSLGRCLRFYRRGLCVVGRL